MKGYLGDAFLSCNPECTENYHCTSNEVCSSNQKCVDACQGHCGHNAICSALNHVARCDCLQGYERHPLYKDGRFIFSCKLSKIFFIINNKMFMTWFHL